MKQFDFHLTHEQKVERKKALDRNTAVNILGVRCVLQGQDVRDEHLLSVAEETVKKLIDRRHINPETIERIEFFDSYMYIESRNIQFQTGFYFMSDEDFFGPYTLEEVEKEIW